MAVRRSLALNSPSRRRTLRRHGEPSYLPFPALRERQRFEVVIDDRSARSTSQARCQYSVMRWPSAAHLSGPD